MLETQVFLGKYRNQILLGVAAVLIAAVLIGGYYFYTARREASASAMLADAKSAADYQKIIADEGGTGAAVSAYLLLAEMQRKEQKLTEANATLQAFAQKNPKNEFVPTAKMAMAGNLESLGKADDAFETYRRVAAEYPRSFIAPFALLSQVHLLKEKGQVDEARRVCETVLTQYRESYASTEASRYLRMLKPSAGTVVVTTPAGASPAPAVVPQASAAGSPLASPAATP